MAYLKIFLLLLGAAVLAGYLPVRLLAGSWPRSLRMALQPLLGAGLTALVICWAHLFAPLGDRLAMIGLVPAAIGSIALLLDLLRRRVRSPGRAGWLWLLMSLCGAAVVLAPFYVLGAATSFGLYSNDAFWWSAADWRVQQYAFSVPDDQVTSPLARVAIKLKRYGFNYLSVMVQSITGMRSWEVVHLNGAFGLFLAIQAGWIFARRLRAWWPLAIIIALGVAANHFIYRVFLDAVLAFQFGFAFFIAIVAIALGPMPSFDIRRRALIVGMLAASMGVFYADLLPATGVAVIAIGFGLLIQRRLRLAHLKVAALGAAVFAIALLPVLLAIPGYVRQVATYVLPGAHYNFADWFRTSLHILGAIDMYQYLHGLPDWWLQYVGAAAGVLLLLRLLIPKTGGWRLIATFGPVILCYSALWFYLLRNGQEYTAHRVMAITTPFAIALIVGSIRPDEGKVSRLWLIVALVAFIANLSPAGRMLDYLRTNYIAVTAAEKQIGDEWMANRLLPGSKVIIDVEEDLELFYGHYMYAEALRGLGGEEDRVILPRTLYHFVTGTPVEEFNPPATEFILRRRGRGRIIGKFRVISSNDRYELVTPLDRESTTLVWFNHGFLPLEGSRGYEFRWLIHEGHATIVTGRKQTLKLMSNLQVNPQVATTHLDINLNGHRLENREIPGWHFLMADIPLEAGTNRLKFTTLKPPVPVPGDPRPVSVRFWTPRFEMAPVEARLNGFTSR